MAKFDITDDKKNNKMDLHIAYKTETGKDRPYEFQTMADEEDEKEYVEWLESKVQKIVDLDGDFIYDLINRRLKSVLGKSFKIGPVSGRDSKLKNELGFRIR